MKRLIPFIIIVLQLLPAQKAAAQDLKRITMGVDWGYVSSFHCGRHDNFFSEIGYRVDVESQSLGYKSNGEVYMHCGYNLNNNWNLSVYAGIEGIYDIHKVIPVSLRATRYFKQNSLGDRWFTFLDGGSGISLTSHPQAIATGKAGCGYRFSLSTATKLDFVASYRMTLTHPELIYDGYRIPKDMINRNNAYVSGISIGLALTF